MNTALDRLFKDPVPQERPIRMLVFGPAKVGKSHFVYTATEVGHLFWFDTEHSSDFYPSERFNVRYAQDPQSATGAIKAATELAASGGEQVTVAIDSASSVWANQQNFAAGRKPKGQSRIPFWVWAEAKAPISAMYNEIHNSLAHVILTCREKTRWDMSEDGKPTDLGPKPDMERNYGYPVDFILHMGIDELPLGEQPKPDNFWARVIGTRTPPEGSELSHIPIGTVFKNPKFADFMRARLEGIRPEQIKDTVSDQLIATSWNSILEAAIGAGWEDEPAVKAAIKDEFGHQKYRRDSALAYWQFLKEGPGE